jgi:fructose-specific phosphotransferase system IIC component
VSLAVLAAYVAISFYARRGFAPVELGVPAHTYPYYVTR